MISTLNYRGILKSTSVAAVPLYLGKNPKNFTKWLGIAAELAYNPHLRNGWVTVDTGVKGGVGSPLIEFSTWEAENSNYNIVIPNSFAYKFLVSEAGAFPKFLTRSSVEAKEVWFSGVMENFVINSWSTRNLSSSLRRLVGNFKLTSVFLLSQRWSSFFFSKVTLGVTSVVPCNLNLVRGLGNLDSFYRDLFSSFAGMRRAVKHRQYRIRFFLYERLSTAVEVNSQATAGFIREIFFTTLIEKFNLLNTRTFKAPLRADSPLFCNYSFAGLLIKLNTLPFLLLEGRAFPLILIVFKKLLSSVVVDLVNIYSLNVSRSAYFSNVEAGNAFVTYLVNKLERVAQITLLSCFSFISLVIFSVKTIAGLTALGSTSGMLSTIKFKNLYSYKFRQFNLKSSIDTAALSLRNKVFLSSQLSLSDFLTTYASHRGNRLWKARPFHKRKKKRSAHFFRRRSKLGVAANKALLGDSGARLLFKKRWKRLWKHFKISSLGAQFNFVFFWSFNFFNFTRLQLGYRKFFYLSVRVIYFFRQFFKFFKFYTFYFQLLRALEFESGVLYSGGYRIFNGVRLYTLLLFKKFGRVLFSFNAFCTKFFMIRWKKLIAGFADPLYKSRGMLVAADVLRVFNFKVGAFLGGSAPLRRAQTLATALLFSKNMLAPTLMSCVSGGLKNSRKYLRYLLNLRKYSLSLWRDQLLLHLGGLPAAPFTRNQVLSNPKSRLENTFLRIASVKRFIFGRSPINNGYFRVFRDFKFSFLGERGRKLLLRLRSRRTFVRNCVFSRIKKLVYRSAGEGNNAASPVLINSYLLFLNRLRGNSRMGARRALFTLIRGGKCLSSSHASALATLGALKHALLISKHNLRARVGSGAARANLITLISNAPYYAQSFSSALLHFGKAFPTLLESTFGADSLYTALVSVTNYLTSYAATNFKKSGGFARTPLSNSLFFRGSFCVENSPHKLNLVVRAPHTQLSDRFDLDDQRKPLFAWFNLQYTRVAGLSVQANSLTHLVQFQVSAINTKLMNNCGGSLLTEVIAAFVRASGFLAIILRLTLMSRFLKMQFLSACTFGAGVKLYSNLVLQKNKAFFNKTLICAVSYNFLRLKQYMGLHLCAFAVKIPLFTWIYQNFYLSKKLGLLYNGHVAVASTGTSPVVFRGAKINRLTSSSSWGFSAYISKNFERGFVMRETLFKPVVARHVVFSRLCSGRRWGKRSLLRKINVAKKRGASLLFSLKIRNKYAVRLVRVSPLSLLTSFLFSKNVLGFASRDQQFNLFKLIQQLRVGLCGRLLGRLIRKHTCGYRQHGLERSCQFEGEVLQATTTLSFLKSILHTTAVTYFRGGLQLTDRRGLGSFGRNSAIFLAGIRGIRPLKLFAHAKRIGLWPKGLKLKPTRVRRKREPVRLVTYRHSKAAAMKSHKVKMPPSIFSRENYESMNLVWDFPHQHYKFARVNTFKQVRAWKHIRRRLVRNLFRIMFRKFRIKSYRRAFRYRKCLRRRWFRLKLKRRVIQRFARVISRFSGLAAMRRVYKSGCLLRKLALTPLFTHSARFTYSLLVKGFIKSLYVKFGHVYTLSKVYFFKTTKLHFLFVLLRAFFFKMLTFFVSYVAVQKVVFDDFLSNAVLFTQFGGLYIRYLGGYALKLGCELARFRQWLLYSVAQGLASGFGLNSDFEVAGGCLRMLNPQNNDYLLAQSFSHFGSAVFCLLKNIVPQTWLFTQTGDSARDVNYLFDNIGFTFFRITRRRTRKIRWNFLLVRRSVFAKPLRSAKISRSLSRRLLVARSRTYWKFKINKLLRSLARGKEKVNARMKLETLGNRHYLRLIFVQIFWYLRSRTNYINLVRILQTASRIIKKRRRKSLVVTRGNLLTSYEAPLWATFRKRRASFSSMRYWRRKKLRRKARLLRRVRRKLLATKLIFSSVKKKKWKFARARLFLNRKRQNFLALRALKPTLRFFVRKSAFARIGCVGNFYVKGSVVGADGFVRRGRGVKFFLKRSCGRTNMVPAYSLRRGSRYLRRMTRKFKMQRPPIRVGHPIKLTKRVISSKKYDLRHNALKAKLTTNS